MSARVGLWLTSVPRVRRVLLYLASRCPPLEGMEAADAELLGTSVHAARRAVPHASCLVQALGAEALFTQSGIPCEIHLGVRVGAGKFGAHAWVESRGQPVVGGRTPRYPTCRQRSRCSTRRVHEPSLRPHRRGQLA